MVVCKRNGTKENWEREKMVISLTNAGVTKIESELLTSLVYESLKTKGSYEIKSSDLRSKVISLLRCIESNCADAYEYFSKNPSD